MRISVFAVLLLIAAVAVGLYRSWFRVSTENADHQPSATITMDKDKIRSDDQKAKDALEGFEQKAKQEFGEPATKTEEPASRP